MCPRTPLTHQCKLRLAADSKEKRKYLHVRGETTGMKRTMVMIMLIMSCAPSAWELPLAACEEESSRVAHRRSGRSTLGPGGPPGAPAPHEQHGDKKKDQFPNGCLDLDAIVLVLLPRVKSPPRNASESRSSALSLSISLFSSESFLLISP